MGIPYLRSGSTLSSPGAQSCPQLPPGSPGTRPVGSDQWQVTALWVGWQTPPRANVLLDHAPQLSSTLLSWLRQGRAGLRSWRLHGLLESWPGKAGADTWVFPFCTDTGQIYYLLFSKAMALLETMSEFSLCFQHPSWCQVCGKCSVYHCRIYE